jgi:radical SAM protein with 4Fe4S-binding SPASM domain
LPQSYGNIATTSLQETLLQQNFKDLWYINKDQIKVCQDCEFRYLCTDCRAFITTPEDKFSKPSKCTYNPYTGEWQNDTETLA